MVLVLFSFGSYVEGFTVISSTAGLRLGKYTPRHNVLSNVRFMFEDWDDNINHSNTLPGVCIACELGAEHATLELVLEFELLYVSHEIDFSNDLEASKAHASHKSRINVVRPETPALCKINQSIHLTASPPASSATTSCTTHASHTSHTSHASHASHAPTVFY